jgi:hypothetical protein
VHHITRQLVSIQFIHLAHTHVPLLSSSGSGAKFLTLISSQFSFLNPCTDHWLILLLGAVQVPHFQNLITASTDSQHYELIQIMMWFKVQDIFQGISTSNIHRTTSWICSNAELTRDYFGNFEVVSDRDNCRVHI